MLEKTNYKWSTLFSSVSVDVKEDVNHCNFGRHPKTTTYRKYRRGKWRCKVCGAKVGVFEMHERVKNSAEKDMYKKLNAVVFQKG